MCQQNKQFDEWWNEQVKDGDGSWTSLERLAAKDAWNAATKLVEEKFTSTNTGRPKLPCDVCSDYTELKLMIDMGNRFCSHCGRLLRLL